MATKEQIIAFLQLWYSGDVKSIEDFRKHDATCKSTPGFKEGDKSTYPSGYDNGSLNQKAHRYVCRKDHNGNTWDNPNWVEPFKGAVKRDEQGNLVLSKSGKPITRRLQSANTNRGKAAASWAKDDFKGFTATDW
jgi:hypothetical protein